MEHHFNVNIANKLGIEEALILHHFYYWTSKNALNEKHFHDGLYWTYNSKSAYVRLFPYMNETKIYRVIKHLEEDGLIVKGNFNTNLWDKTNWYAITMKGLDLLDNNGYDMNAFSSLFQNDVFDNAKMNDGVGQSERTILYNNTNNNKEEGINIPSKKNNYKAIVDCWNQSNGKRLGIVTKITERRKKAIKKQIEDNGITQEQLMSFFKTIPFADKWLYNPNKQHKNWKPDFDWWLANTSGWLTKGLEGKVHKENQQAFTKIMKGEDAPYSPQCDVSLNWNDYYQCYMYIGYWDGKHIPDGYNDNERPNGASVTLNNGRGTLVWNSEKQKWNKL